MKLGFGFYHHMLNRENYDFAVQCGATHAVVNPDKQHYRTHMICDYESTDALLELLAFADKDLGTPVTAGVPPV